MSTQQIIRFLVFLIS